MKQQNLFASKTVVSETPNYNKYLNLSAGCIIAVLYSYLNMEGFNMQTDNHRFSLPDVDERLKYIPDLALALGVDPESIMLHILEALKMKLKSDVKKTSESKRQRLLEYLLPYAVLEDYSPLVTYLLERESNIPDVVMEKLLHDFSFSNFLTPVIKSNIYKSKPEFFIQDMTKIISSLPIGDSIAETIFNKCPNPDKESCRSYFPQVETVATLDSLRLAVGKDDQLNLLLVSCLVDTFQKEKENHSIDWALQRYNLLYEFLKESPNVIISLNGNEISPSEKSSILYRIQNFISSMNMVIQYDRTMSVSLQRRADASVYQPIIILLRSLCQLQKPQTPPLSPLSPDNSLILKRKCRDAFEKCVDEMLRLDENQFFSFPVTDAIAPAYSTVVKKPMDLMTMKAKCGEYETTRDIVDDVKQIVKNCEMFNGVQTPITQILYEVRKKWQKELLKCETTERSYRQAYPISPTQAVAVISPVDIRGYLLLLLGIAFSTSLFYTQLLRAIYMRILQLAENTTIPVDNGMLELNLYQYYKLLLLSNCIPQLLNEVKTGKSDDKLVIGLINDGTETDIPETYRNAVNYLFQVVFLSMQGTSGPDSAANLLIECEKTPANRHLLYTACCVQVMQAISLRNPSVEEYERVIKIFDALVNIVVKLNETFLIKEWSWIECIGLTIMASKNANLRGIATIYIEKLLANFLVIEPLFYRVFSSLFNFCQCCVIGGNILPDTFDEICTFLAKKIYPKHELHSLGDSRENDVKSMAANYPCFGSLLSSIFSDYVNKEAIPPTIDIPFPSDLLLMETEKRPTSVISSPISFTPDNEPEPEEDDFY